MNDRLDQSVAGALLQAPFPQQNVNQNGLFGDGRQGSIRLLLGMLIQLKHARLGCGAPTGCPWA